VFDTRLSPGTLYPQLHELEDEGLLTVQELVRTKEYRVDDEEALAERVTAAAEQHLALGLFFHAALEDLS
jgi:DNA-binding PadR family transcriptional regulator